MTDNFSHLFTAAAPSWRAVFATPRLVLTCLCLLGLTACDDKLENKTPPPRPVRTVLAPSPAVSGAYTQTGEIRPHDETQLGFRLDGRLLTRTVDVGDPVYAGQVLATLEDSTSQNQLESARADLDSAQAAERLAALDLKRMTQLSSTGAIARIQLDTARSDWQSAVSRRRSSEAALKSARDRVDWTQLTAPVAGVVTQIGAEPGQVISAGQTVITLAGNRGRDAVINAANPQIFASRDEEVNVSLLTAPSEQARGHVRDISPQADPQTRTWRVRIALDNPPASMALGASVEVTLPGAGPAVMRLPASALTRIDGRPAVFVVDTASRKLELRPVTLAGFTSDAILVTDGIHPGEPVVTAGTSKLRAGEQVATGGDRP